MSRGRPRASLNRRSQLTSGRELLASLLTRTNPIESLRDPSVLESLGVPPGSPFRGGSLRGLHLETELASAIEGLPPLESGISRPALPLTVAVFGEESLHEVFKGAAVMTEVDPFDWEAGVRNAHAVMLGPRSARTHRARGRVIGAARELSLSLLYVDLGTDAPRPDQLTLAARCDHIFAVSEENAERYRSEAPRSTSVELIASPISPLVRSPLGSQSMKDPLVTYFQNAGARLAPDVAESLEWILDGVAAAGPGLLISPGRRPEHPLQIRHWPYVQEWASRVRGDLDRLSDIGVAAHEISGSQTAFSPRAIELQASGSMVLSTYNQGINSYYPQIHVANSTQDVATMLDNLELKDLRRNQSDGLRQVFNENHATDVLRVMLHHAGVTDPSTPSRVLAVAEEADDTLLAEMSAQSAGAVETVAWQEARERHGQYDVLIPVSARRHYSPTYVADHLAALSYQSAPVVAKHTDPSAPGHVHLETVSGDLALTAWWRPERDLAMSPAALQQQLSDARVYVSDGFGQRERTGRARRTPSLLGAGDDFNSASEDIGRTARELNLQLSVVVPVYNNGPHLRHKAFASLLRSSAFEEMHVLLVSDGSTDPLTLDIIEDLVDEYPNVSSFHHSRGGSGSASRPRNTGLDLAQTPYVTYLDPDNEAIDDGYAQLYDEIQEHPRVDFVLGNMSQWAKRRTMLPYAEVLQSLFADDVDPQGNISVPPRALESLRFRPMGIQTVIARTEWLKSLNLTQPLGAVGQDSYFFQQMLHYASSVRTVDVGVHTYYMVVSNSTVNTLNSNYFKKYLPLDKARAHWLSEVGLLESYKQERLEPFLVSWLLPKLRRVQDDEWYEAAENLAELLNYYGDYRWTQPAAIDFWDDLRRVKARRAKSQR